MTRTVRTVWAWARGEIGAEPIEVRDRADLARLGGGGTPQPSHSNAKGRPAG